MKKVIEAYSGCPIDQIGIRFMPLCGPGGFEDCQKQKNGQPVKTTCAWSTDIPVSSCRKVLVTIEDGR